MELSVCDQFFKLTITLVPFLPTTKIIFINSDILHFDHDHISAVTEIIGSVTIFDNKFIN